MSWPLSPPRAMPPTTAAPPPHCYPLRLWRPRCHQPPERVPRLYTVPRSPYLLCPHWNTYRDDSTLRRTEAAEEPLFGVQSKPMTVCSKSQHTEMPTITTLTAS